MVEAKLDNDFIQAVLQEGEFERGKLTRDQAQAMEKLLENDVPEKITLKDLAEAIVNLDKTSKEEELAHLLNQKLGREKEKITELKKAVSLYKEIADLSRQIELGLRP